MRWGVVLAAAPASPARAITTDYLERVDMTEKIQSPAPEDTAKCANPSREATTLLCEAVRDIIRSEWRGFWNYTDIVEELPDVFNRAYDKLSAKK